MLAWLIKLSLDGVVCSPLEAELISRELGPEFMKVTPGIRPKGAAQNDQQRITTPEEAQTLGSTYSSRETYNTK